MWKNRKARGEVARIDPSLLVKPKQSLWPITTDENNTRNQSELEANTCNRRQARENACDQVTIGFSLASDWLRKWREFFEPIR